jgi:hypothetical protein
MPTLLMRSRIWLYRHNSKNSAEEKIAEILDAKLDGQLTTPTAATAEEQAVWAMSTDTLDAYLNQMIKPSKFYEQLLRVLPGA